MYTRVKPYVEPIDIFEKLGERASELSDIDLGFIGGIIRDHRPKKIVEIGVSAGGTTAFVLNCLSKLSLECEMWSVDLSTTYHKDTRKPCGFQIKPALSHLDLKTSHHLILGKNIAQILPTICTPSKDKSKSGGVDLLILDTIHYLPGELLDLIVCLPYLSEDAIVIFDDLYFWNGGENRAAVATRVCYSSILAHRLVPAESDGYVKMAGIQINELTISNVAGLFECLSLPWYYTMTPAEILLYRDLVCEKYEQELVSLFDEAVAVNREALDKQNRIKNEVKKLIEVFSVDKPVYIFGAGKRGQALMKFLQDRGLCINGFLVSPGREKNAMEKVQIFYPDEISLNESQIILAVADWTAKRTLEEYGCEYVEAPNYIFPFLKKYVDLLC